MTRTVTTHTMETLHARCVEEGDCWVWGGYVQNGAPYICQSGKLTAVRQITMTLSERPIRIGAKYFATTCGDPLCVNPEHIVCRTPKEHMTRMASQVQHRAVSRVVKLQTAARARAICKLTEASANSILLDARSHRAIAIAHGISKSLVSNIKRGVCWRPVSAQANPWAGLMP